MSRTQVIAVISAIVLVFFVLEQVRRRRLREEYSWLWLVTAVSYFLMAVCPDLCIWVIQFIGSTNPVSAFTFLGLYFLVLISIQYSIQLSKLTTQSKDLAQQIAILDCELERLSQAFGVESGSDQSTVILQLVEQNENLERQVAILGRELERLGQTCSDRSSVGQRLEKQISAERSNH